MENCWKSRDYYKSRNSVAAFENTSGDLFFSFSDILLMTSGEKIGVFFLFWGGGSLTNSWAAELFLLETWRSGLIMPVGKVGRQFFFPTQSLHEPTQINHRSCPIRFADSVTWSKFLRE